MVIQLTATLQTNTAKESIMFTSAKTAAFVATTIVAAHFVAFGSAAVSLQTSADHAMIPVIKAEPIIVRASSLQIVKADRIEVRASRAA